MELAGWIDDFVIDKPDKLFLKCVDFHGHESISGQLEELQFQELKKSILMNTCWT
jgi:hypothetical protein